MLTSLVLSFLFGAALLWPFTVPCERPGLSFFFSIGGCSINDAKNSLAFRITFSFHFLIQGLLRVGSALFLARYLMLKVKLAKHRLSSYDQDSNGSQRLLQSHSQFCGYLDRQRETFWKTLVILLIFCLFALVCCLVIQFWSIIYDSTYLFCLYVLLSNGVQVGLLTWTLKRTVWKRHIDSSQELSWLSLDRFQAQVAFSMFHITFALVLRMWLFVWSAKSVVLSDGLGDTELAMLRKTLKTLIKEAHFFVWGAVLTSRTIQVASETLFIVISRMWGSYPDEKSWRKRLLNFLSSLQRDRSDEVWFVMFLNYEFSSVYGWLNPTICLTSCVGLLYEQILQFYREKLLKAPPLRRDSPIPFLIPLNISWIPILQVGLLVTTLTLWKPWMAITAASSLLVNISILRIVPIRQMLVPKE